MVKKKPTVESWKCACGATFETENEADKHLGPGHPWLSKMINGGMAFIHADGDSWMFEEPRSEVPV